MLELEGKTAIVTGSTSGIGLAIAEDLAAGGAQVIMNGLGTEEQIADAIGRVTKRSPGAKVTFNAADLREPKQIAAMIDSTAAEFGAVDILVDNAGVQHTDPVEVFPPAKWDEIIAVNLSAVFHATARALTGMRAHNYGRIVNIASVHGLVASKNKAAYVAAKHGVVGLTKVTALENAEQNITCNAICPAWVLTPLVQAQIEKKARIEEISEDDVARALLVEKEPSLRFTKAEHIAAAVRFLVSPAGGNMTGSCMTMDGGWSAQ